MELFLNTSERSQREITLLDNKGRIIERVVTKGDILSSIEELLKRKGLEAYSLEKASIYPGPGSFTSLRMGCAVANALNYALGLKDAKHLVTPNYSAPPKISLARN